MLPPASSQARNFNKHITPAKLYGKEKDKSAKAGKAATRVRSGALPTLDPRTFFPSDLKLQAEFFAEYQSRPLYKIYVRVL